MAATVTLKCEPAADEKIDRQSDGRTHRLGQTQPTTCIVFAAEGTLEQDEAEICEARWAKDKAERESGAHSAGSSNNSSASSRNSGGSSNGVHEMDVDPELSAPSRAFASSDSKRNQQRQQQQQEKPQPEKRDGKDAKPSSSRSNSSASSSRTAMSDDDDYSESSGSESEDESMEGKPSADSLLSSAATATGDDDEEETFVAPPTSNRPGYVAFPAVSTAVD